MALHTLPTQTTNFKFQYFDSLQIGLFGIPLPNARARAEALLRTCEQDFAVLKDWVTKDLLRGGVKDPFGEGNRITVRVQPDALAHNNGYHADGSTLITLDPLEPAESAVQLGAGLPPLDPSVADDGVRALFVAEAIEILMDYRNKRLRDQMWHPGYSDGEGLSRVAAATLHPIGYYTLPGTPGVNTWLMGTRGNWVATINPTDLDMDSFGCAILFIYYLRDQLGFPMTAIVQRAGGTLEETYQNLTGNTIGFKPFRDLLKKYLPFDPKDPLGPNSINPLPTDNPFPILEGQQRRVTLSFKEQDDLVVTSKLGVKSGKHGRVTLKPFFNCPEKNYEYTIYDRNLQLQCVATVSGFARPKFTWKVNGLHADVGGSIMPTTTVLVDDPAHPDKPKSMSKAVRIYWQNEKNVSTFQGMAGELDLHNSGYDGHVHLRIDVEVSETFGTSDTVSQTGFTALDTQELVYDAQFYADRDDCVNQFEKTVRRYVKVNNIPLVFTLPDPSPEIRVASRLLKEIIGELQGISAKNPELGRGLARTLAETLQLPEQVLLTALQTEGQTTAPTQDLPKTVGRQSRRQAALVKSQRPVRARKNKS